MVWTLDNIIWVSLLVVNIILLFPTKFKMKWFVSAYLFFSVSSVGLSLTVLPSMGINARFLVLILLNFFIIICLFKQGAFLGKQYLILFLWIQIITYIIALGVDMRNFIFHGLENDKGEILYRLSWVPVQFNLLEWMKKIELITGVINGAALYFNRENGSSYGGSFFAVHDLHFRKNVNWFKKRFQKRGAKL